MKTNGTNGDAKLTNGNGTDDHDSNHHNNNSQDENGKEVSKSK